VNVAVRAIRLATDGVHVVTDGDSYFGDRVIVATGAWFPELAPKPDAKAVTVTRQAVFFFEDDDPSAFGVDRFPFVICTVACRRVGHSLAALTALMSRAPEVRCRCWALECACIGVGSGARSGIEGGYSWVP